MRIGRAGGACCAPLHSWHRTTCLPLLALAVPAARLGPCAALCRCCCRAFTLGSSFIAEVDLVLDPEMTVREAHDIGEPQQHLFGRSHCPCACIRSTAGAALPWWSGMVWRAGQQASGLLSQHLACCPPAAGESLQVKLELLPEVSRACEPAQSHPAATAPCSRRRLPALFVLLSPACLTMLFHVPAQSRRSHRL